MWPYDVPSDYFIRQAMQTLAPGAPQQWGSLTRFAQPRPESEVTKALKGLLFGELGRQAQAPGYLAGLVQNQPMARQVAGLLGDGHAPTNYDYASNYYRLPWISPPAPAGGGGGGGGGGLLAGGLRPGQNTGADGSADGATGDGSGGVGDAGTVGAAVGTNAGNAAAAANSDGNTGEGGGGEG